MSVYYLKSNVEPLMLYVYIFEVMQMLSVRNIVGIDRY